MPYKPRPWNEWYRQHDKEGESTALWAGILKVVRCHRYRKVEDNEATANMVMYKFIVFAENHRGEIESDLFSDARLEAVIQKITRNELITEYRGSNNGLLVQLNTQEYADDDQTAPRSTVVSIEEASQQSTEKTPEHVMVDKEIDDEIKLQLKKKLTERQRYIFDRYWDFDGDRSDMDAGEIAARLRVSLATFHREIKRIKEIVRPICLTARKKRLGYRSY